MSDNAASHRYENESQLLDYATRMRQERDEARERLSDAYKTIRILTGAEDHVACPSLSCPYEARFRQARAQIRGAAH